MRTNDLDRLTIRSSGSIRQAMQTITDNWKEIALVVDPGERLIGVITDGDIRRGLLRGLNLESPAEEVMTQEFIAVGPDVSRTAVLETMHSRSIRHLPVLDAAGRLIGIHFLQDFISMTVLPNIAVIMAGGKGVRLRPLTENCPKPMMRVAGRPILERLVLHLVGSGFRQLYITVNYLGHVIEEYFGEGSRFGCSIRYVRETHPMGTAGALALLPEVPEYPFFVINGDLVTQVNMNDMLRFHCQGGFRGTIGVKPHKVEIPYGVIQKRGDCLSQITEKPIMDFQINAGIYILEPSLLSNIPPDAEFPITSLFSLLLEKSEPLGVYLIEEDWLDVGRHADLRKAQGAE